MASSSIITAAAAASSRSMSGTIVGVVIATLPVLIWIKDKGFGLYYVSGRSMEPTLHHGDIVLVVQRNLHMPLLLHSTTTTTTTTMRESGGTNDHVVRGNNKNNSVLLGNHTFPPNADEFWERDLEDAVVRRREQVLRQPHMQQYQQYHHPPVRYHDQQKLQQQQQHQPWLGWTTTSSSSSTTPVVVLPGQVIVYWSPIHYQQLCIKRVIGVGGQIVLPRDFPSRLDLTKLTRRTILHYLVPPSYWYVEGDNADVSSDSRHYGPVPQRLLVGIVHCIIWPFHRAQIVPRCSSSCHPPPPNNNNNNFNSHSSYPISRTWWL